MKIGVITTQYSPNYGALLQAYALQSFLKQINVVENVEVIDYFPKHASSFWKVYSTKKDIRNRLHNVYLFLHRKSVKAKKKQLEVFGQFIRENLKCSQRYSTETIEQTRNDYDVFICGSDQIWNMTRHDDPIWFLYFTKNWSEKKKIAYAPSIADKVPARCYDNLKKYINNLDMVSVRESADVEQLYQITQRKAFHACDPVFLLSQEEWSQIVPEKSIPRPYILCYFISTGDYAVSVVNRVKELTGLEVVHINVNIRDRFKSEWDIHDCSPFEFVSYIKNATYICTNSFHCTAFSLLFKKDFIIVPKKTANSRMESVMKKANIENRFIYPERLAMLKQSDLKVNYSNTCLDEWISESKKYLLKGIGADAEGCRSC